MWMDDQGVCHTVALSDPTILMSEEFQLSFAYLVQAESDTVYELLEREENLFYTQIYQIKVDERSSRYIGAPAPAAVIEGSADSLDHLQSTIRAIDFRWRLDAIVHLDDLYTDLIAEV